MGTEILKFIEWLLARLRPNLLDTSARNSVLLIPSMIPNLKNVAN